MKIRRGEKNSVLFIFIVLCIPVLLIIDAFQANRYKQLRRELSALERRQVELVEKNRDLISEISILSSSDRIEKIAENELKMHKVSTEDIVRVEMKSK